MRAGMIKFITAVFFTLASLAGTTASGQVPTAPLALKQDAPERYVVVRGDTLWDIAGRYTDSPWRWPELWDMNKDAIRNPHLIYPGNVILFDRSTGRLTLEGSETLRRTPGATASLPPIPGPGPGPQAGPDTAPPEAPRDGGGSAGVVVAPTGTFRLSPRVRAEFLEREAIPSIPLKDIEPFLVRPLVVEEDGLDNAPTIVAADDNRVVLGPGNLAYVRGIRDASVRNWLIYRRGKALVDPDTDRTLGYEATHVGAAALTHAGDLSVLRVTTTKQEVLRGDKLVPEGSVQALRYVPHAPAKEIRGKVLAIYSGIGYIGEAGPADSILTLNRGHADGIEVGHVLALSRAGERVVTDDGKRHELPDERFGLIFVFRVFERVSYALVMKVSKPVNPRDIVATP